MPPNKSPRSNTEVVCFLIECGGIKNPKVYQEERLPLPSCCWCCSPGLPLSYSGHQLNLRPKTLVPQGSGHTDTIQLVKMWLSGRRVCHAFRVTWVQSFGTLLICLFLIIKLVLWMNRYGMVVSIQSTMKGAHTVHFLNPHKTMWK